MDQNAKKRKTVQLRKQVESVAIGDLEPKKPRLTDLAPSGLGQEDVVSLRKRKKPSVVDDDKNEDVLTEPKHPNRVDRIESDNDELHLIPNFSSAPISTSVSETVETVSEIKSNEMKTKKDVKKNPYSSTGHKISSRTSNVDLCAQTIAEVASLDYTPPKQEQDITPQTPSTTVDLTHVSDVGEGDLSLESVNKKKKRPPEGDTKQKKDEKKESESVLKPEKLKRKAPVRSSKKQLREEESKCKDPYVYKKRGGRWTPPDEPKYKSLPKTVGNVKRVKVDEGMYNEALFTIDSANVGDVLYRFDQRVVRNEDLADKLLDDPQKDYLTYTQKILLNNLPESAKDDEIKKIASLSVFWLSPQTFLSYWLWLLTNKNLTLPIG